MKKSAHDPHSFIFTLSRLLPHQRIATCY